MNSDPGNSWKPLRAGTLGPAHVGIPSVSEASQMNPAPRHESLFRCPISGMPLRVATAGELHVLNTDIESRTRMCQDGTPVASKLEAALCTSDLRHVYRVEEGIYWLLPGLAITAAAESRPLDGRPEKAVVQTFYDEYGWVKRDDGLYRDTADFTDTREIARSYQRICNARIARHLAGGTYLLDAASGAIPLPEYLSLSDGYATRICLDFSTRALREAQAKLGSRGLYVLGDITCLPFRDGSIDDVISLHTIYHVPEAQQATAVDELVRVVRPGGRVVIVYVWPRSLAMDFLTSLRSKLGIVLRLGRPPRGARAATTAAKTSPSLYFKPQGFDWYRRAVEKNHGAKLRVWALVDSFRFLPDGVVGKLSLGLIRCLEGVMPRMAGRLGKYPMFVVKKS